MSSMPSPDRPDLGERDAERHSSGLGPQVASDVQALFLLRLKDLLERRHSPAGRTLPGPEQLMLDRAIYSTFCDCLELNVSNQARSLLRELRDN